VSGCRHQLCKTDKCEEKHPEFGLLMTRV